MKKLLFFLATTICFVGCNSPIEKNISISDEPAIMKYYKCDMAGTIYTIEIEGHKYIVLSGGSYRGEIIHAEHCNCKNK